MTRANIIIIDGTFAPRTTKFQSNSSAYPSWVLPNIIKACMSAYSNNRGATNNFYTEIDSTALSTLIDDLGLTLGTTSANYHYTLDFFNKTLTIHGTKSVWVNAPKDWKAKGWQGCYEEKGKFGYRDHNRKGKVILFCEFKDLYTKNRKGEVITKSVEIKDNNEKIIKLV